MGLTSAVLTLTWRKSTTFSAKRLLSFGFRQCQEVLFKAVFCMHTNRPVTRMFNGAAPGKLSGLRVFLMFLLGAGMICGYGAGSSGAGSQSL
jgi:hypothetical protein